MTELDEFPGLLLILIVEYLEMLGLPWVFSFKQLYKLPLHLPTVLLDQLLWVGLELLYLLLVGY